MEKRIWFFFAAVLLAAACLLLALGARETPYESWLAQTRKALPAWSETQRLSMEDGWLERREYRDGSQTYTFPNGDFYWQKTARTGGERVVWVVESASCTLRYSLPGGETWVVEKDPDAFRQSRTVFLEFDGLRLLLAPPQAYAPMERDCLRSLGELDGQILLTRLGEETWEVGLELPPSQGEDVRWHWYCLASDAPLVSWQDPAQEKEWLGYSMTDRYRWCGTGMYQQSPEDYDPSGQDVYFRNPASYIPAKFVTQAAARAAEDLGVAMLDCVRRELNEDGFIPISTRSGWLYRDYGIGHGYYDTRWATDLALALVRAADRFGLPEFRQSARDYGEFLCRHIRDKGFVLPGRTGVLAPDYSWDGEHATTHGSLNHLLAEALLLYRVEETAAADSLVSAIEEVGMDWLRPDGNLKYGLMPDGAEIGGDYPYLTYNDLFLLREYFLQEEEEFPSALEELMAAKLAWMTQNGVTGYLGEE